MDERSVGDRAGGGGLTGYPAGGGQGAVKGYGVKADHVLGRVL